MSRHEDPSPPPRHLTATCCCLATLWAMAAAGLQAPSSAAEGDCIGDREALLALDQQAFDQDLEGGWRPIAEREGCRAAAADLIRDYRERAARSAADRGDVVPPGRFDILFWHEAQLRAIGGDTEVAVALFRQAYGPHSSATWTPYAEATIAFLERDREALLRARAALVALQPPADWEERVREVKEQFDLDMAWPPNLDVVDGLLRCFDRSYAEAYGGECRTPGEP